MLAAAGPLASNSACLPTSQIAWRNFAARSGSQFACSWASGRARTRPAPYLAVLRPSLSVAEGYDGLRRSGRPSIKMQGLELGYG
jgi:hypothetical protein